MPVPVPVPVPVCVQVQSMAFFKSTSPAFLRAIVTRLRPQVCLEGDFVIRSGDLARDMFFLHKGRVEITRDGKTLLELAQGSFFGEAALLAKAPAPDSDDEDEEDVVLRAKQRRRNADVKALTFCYMFALGADDFADVITAFPELHAHTKTLLMARMTQEGRRSSTSPAASPSDKLSLGGRRGSTECVFRVFCLRCGGQLTRQPFCFVIPLCLTLCFCR